MCFKFQSVRSSEDAAEIIALKERLRQQNTRHEQVMSEKLFLHTGIPNK